MRPVLHGSVILIASSVVERDVDGHIVEKSRGSLRLLISTHHAIGKLVRFLKL